MTLEQIREIALNNSDLNLETLARISGLEPQAILDYMHDVSRQGTCPWAFHLATKEG